jgi:hypothetical protein
MHWGLEELIGRRMGIKAGLNVDIRVVERNKRYPEGSCFPLVYILLLPFLHTFFFIAFLIPFS